VSDSVEKRFETDIYIYKMVKVKFVSLYSMKAWGGLGGRGTEV